MSRSPSLDEMWTAAHRSRPLGVTVRLVSAARAVPGDEWIARRREPRYPGGAFFTYESAWWGEALEALNRELLKQAMAPGPVLRRRIVINELNRSVILTVDTRAEGRNPWGLLTLVLQVPQLACPPGGDLLHLPGE